MKRRLLDFARCPGCHGQIEVVAGDMGTSTVDNGLLACVDCQRQYSVQKGIAFLHLDDDTWTSKAVEAQGWVDYHKMKGIYDQTGVGIDFMLPYFPEEPWIEVARSFDIGLEIAHLKGGERILDLGAGRGWAAKHFALRGCEVVALDVVPDDQIGLGRSRALMERDHTYYELMIADSENLPFVDDTFDIVFCCGVLHHATDLAVEARNIHRVLKPNGRLIAINEPCIPESQSEAEALEVAAEELACGINERRWDFTEQQHTFQLVGFQDIQIFPWNAYHLSEEAMRHWATELGVVVADAKPVSNTNARRVFNAARWLQKTLLRHGAPQTRIASQSNSERERLIHDILRQCGGSIIICARK